MEINQSYSTPGLKVVYKDDSDAVLEKGDRVTVILSHNIKVIGTFIGEVYDDHFRVDIGGNNVIADI